MAEIRLISSIIRSMPVLGQIQIKQPQFATLIGYYQQVDRNINADFTYNTSQTLSWALEVEYRVEEFTIGAGDINSWVKGPSLLIARENRHPLALHQWIPGFSPDIAGVFERSNIAAYIEADWDVSDQFWCSQHCELKNLMILGLPPTTSSEVIIK